MRKLLIIGYLLAASAGMNAQQEMGIEAILKQIANNNRQLQAYAQTASAQKYSNRADNNLPNPTVNYAHLWDSKDKNITVGELVVAQSFDFPTLYATRGKLNRTRNAALDANYTSQRQEVLLQAKTLCLDIIMLYRQQQLIDERLHNAEEMAALYHKRLEEGDANIIETNKTQLELLNVRTEARLNQSSLQSRIKELVALNDLQPLGAGRPLPGPTPYTPEMLNLTETPTTPLPTDFQKLCEELIAADASLQTLRLNAEAARRNVSINRQGWLPGLELGYRRNTESGHPLNGIVVGFSIPLFNNHGKVNAARADKQAADYQHESARLTTESSLWQIYDEATVLQKSIREYEETMNSQSNQVLLRKALDGGEISLIEYFAEIEILYKAQANLIALQTQYEKAMAQLYKSRL